MMLYTQMTMLKGTFMDVKLLWNALQGAIVLIG